MKSIFSKKWLFYSKNFMIKNGQKLEIKWEFKREESIFLKEKLMLSHRLILTNMSRD